MGAASSMEYSQDEMDQLKQLMQDHKVLVLSKTYCPFCTKAKRVGLHGKRDSVSLYIVII